MNIIAVTGWTLMVGAVLGVLSSVYLEYQAHEPKYALIMKIQCLFIGIAGILIGIG